MRQLVRTPAQKHVALIGDMGVHAMREVCQGAAEVLAAQRHINMDIWPVVMDTVPVLENWSVGRLDGLLVARWAVPFIRQHVALRPVPRVSFLEDVDAPRRLTVGLDEHAIGRMAFEHLRGRGYCVEWTYAKAEIIRRQLAQVLAWKIAQGQYTRDEAVAIARATLFETPQELLGTKL